MKRVFPNIWMLLLRIALLSLFVYFYQWPLEKIRSGQFQSNPTLFWIGFIAISMFPTYIVWTLFGVLWVSFSDDNTKIRFHHFYKTIETTGADIDGYFRTIHKTRVTKYRGLIIKLKTDKVVEVTEYNLKSVADINNFLKDNKVPLRGDKNSWFPLKRRI